MHGQKSIKLCDRDSTDMIKIIITTEILKILKKSLWLNKGKGKR